MDPRGAGNLSTAHGEDDARMFLQTLAAVLDDLTSGSGPRLSA